MQKSLRNSLMNPSMTLRGPRILSLWFLMRNSRPVKKGYFPQKVTRWFSIFFQIFTPKFGEDDFPNLTSISHIFQMGGSTNHQPGLWDSPGSILDVFLDPIEDRSMDLAKFGNPRWWFSKGIPRNYSYLPRWMRLVVFSNP